MGALRSGQGSRGIRQPGHVSILTKSRNSSRCGKASGRNSVNWPRRTCRSSMVVRAMTDQSNSDSPRRRIAVKEADLDELYLLVQGAPYANTLLDAKVTLSHHDLAKTLQLVQSGRSRYRQSHWRILRRDGDETVADEQGSKEGRDCVNSWFGASWFWRLSMTSLRSWRG